MVVPFQMVMFTLSKVTDTLKLNTPWGLIIIYLGFGAGLAVFMFCVFVKSTKTLLMVMSRFQPTASTKPYFSMAVWKFSKPTKLLETMWIWNDFLLPYLTLDRNKYNTIPMVIQMMQGSYGRVDMGAIMACLTMTATLVPACCLRCFALLLG